MNDQRSHPASAAPASRNALLRAGFLLYRHVLSPILHSTHRTLTGTTGACRFQPTCSEYAALAMHLHGPRHGSRLALLRLLRCHPFARGGFDPVPGPLSKNDPHHRVSQSATSLGPAETARHLS